MISGGEETVESCGLFLDILEIRISYEVYHITCMQYNKIVLAGIVKRSLEIFLGIRESVASVSCKFPLTLVIPFVCPCNMGI